MTNTHKLQLSKEDMKQYGYQVIDAIVDHFDTERSKKPVAFASRKEMDSLFNMEVPEEASSYQKVLDFVVKEVLPNSNIEIGRAHV